MAVVVFQRLTSRLRDVRNIGAHRGFVASTMISIA